MGFLKVACARLTFLCLVSVQINSDENICKEGLVGEQRKGEPVLSEEIKIARHAQPNKMKAEMPILCINKPRGLKEAGRRFAINTSMNGYHLAVNELREKLHEGTWQCELLSNRPVRARGWGKEENNSPRGRLRWSLINSHTGLWDVGVKPSAQRAPASPMLLTKNETGFFKSTDL